MKGSDQTTWMTEMWSVLFPLDGIKEMIIIIIIIITIIIIKLILKKECGTVDWIL
jgi:hypothetical protein